MKALLQQKNISPNALRLGIAILYLIETRQLPSRKNIMDILGVNRQRLYEAKKNIMDIAKLDRNIAILIEKMDEADREEARKIEEKRSRSREVEEIISELERTRKPTLFQLQVRKVIKLWKKLTGEDVKYKNVPRSFTRKIRSGKWKLLDISRAIHKYKEVVEDKDKYIAGKIVSFDRFVATRWGLWTLACFLDFDKMEEQFYRKLTIQEEGALKLRVMDWKLHSGNQEQWKAWEKQFGKGKMKRILFTIERKIGR